MQKTAVVLRN